MNQIDLPDTTEIQSRSTSIVRQAQAIVIQSDDDYRVTGERLKGIKLLERDITTTFGPTVHKTHEAHKSALDAQAKFLRPVQEAERVIRGKMEAYRRELDLRRREEEVAARRAMEEHEEDRRYALAAKLEEEGRLEEANEVLHGPKPPASLVVAPPAPTVEGISTPKRWDFEIVDADKLPRDVLVPDMTKIRQLVRALGEKAQEKIPGIRVFKHEGLSVRVG